ncbi:hypothetical protein HMPREF1327_00010 [Enterococcus faecalis 599]|nr:hypothetical protein HMPREF1327_00010 [Enterococcus faecalis 599]
MLLCKCEAKLSKIMFTPKSPPILSRRAFLHCCDFSVGARKATA